MPRKSQHKDSEFHLKPAQVKKIIHAAVNFRDRCIIKMLAHSAVRRVEITTLDIRDLDFKQGLIHIRNGKGGKTRSIPFSDDLASDLKHLIGTRKTGPVFMSQRQGPLTVRQVNNLVAAAGRVAKVENPNPKYDNITCHLFRHTFAREWKKRGGSIEGLSKVLGHTSVKTTLDEYGTMDLADVQEEYERLMG